MSLNTLKAKAAKATQKAATLVQEARASKTDCVLVVYDNTAEASIYFEDSKHVAPPRKTV